ncbi:hypothetical protein C7H79_10660 [Nitrosomonas supralitoralis]|uniref:DUF883 domain-containing protein n=2 Tax=Nitrosomonas supralitoralis TaxID=2116706 RepID=A0A2P7NU08_9PROT|nr:hypothetical protein C7H79_10660 [Nitrosomonas supralitoralis]
MFRNAKHENLQSHQRTLKKVNRTMDDAEEEGQPMVNEAKVYASEVIDDVKQEASKIAEQHLQNVACQISGVAKAFAITAENLKNEHSWIADGARQAAQKRDKISESLRENDFGALVHDFENYTRKQPALVLGGAAIAGFFLTKLLKDSSNHDDVTVSEKSNQNNLGVRSSGNTRGS